MNRRKIIISLIFFVAIGFLLRSYNFSEWLRFNADQSRDARLAIDFAEGRIGLPLLGPMAGGTEFKLGPAFYYFQIASVYIFGNEPDVAAYPDLLFSILAIPLLFLFARIFFSLEISLMLTWLYAISYFVVKYSRFAWNPNSTPFFVMLQLYSFYRLIISKDKSRLVWAIIGGVALGINVQLHTSLLIILPVVTVFSLALLFKKGRIDSVIVALFLASAVFVNIPQILSEVRTGAINTRQFIMGVSDKNGRNSSFGKNILMDISCHIKANGHILSALGDEEDCGYNSSYKTFKKLDGKRMTLSEKSTYVLLSIAAMTFSLGGYLLLLRARKKETDEDRKLMLVIFSAYVGISFIFFITWATELSIRFFLGLSFVPFFLLGFWIVFLSARFNKKVTFILIAAMALSYFNLRQIHETYTDLKKGGREINGNFDYATLGEEKFIVDFLKKNSNGDTTLYLDAQAGYLFKMLRPLQYLSEKHALILVQFGEDVKLQQGSRLFYIKSADSGCRLPQKTSDKYEVEECSIKGQFSIFSLKVK